MDYRTLLLVAVSAPLLAIPAGAVTVKNTGTTALKLGIETQGESSHSKDIDIAPGQTATFECKSGCGLSGPWEGLEWAKGDQNFTTDGKTIDSM
ncbi:MAG: hypothetical protein JSR99_01560 [Proteobacteria bacterium]|nr:hypothetical protein [Pseudomonadota bacterium]